MPPVVTPPAPTIACTRCGRGVPAHAAAYEPVLCLTCMLVAGPAPALEPSAMRVKRRLWPWLVAVGITGAALAGGLMLWERSKARHRFETEFPVVATSTERTLLAREAKAWTKGKQKLVAALGTFDPSTVRVRPDAAACPLFQNTTSASAVDAANLDQSKTPKSWAERIGNVQDRERLVGLRLTHGAELVAKAEEQIDLMLGAAKRGRFRGELARERVIGMIGDDALIVFDLKSDRTPEIQTGIEGKEFVSGYLEGNAFAFDRETGELRCAGQFQAESSDEVNVLMSSYGAIGNERDAVRRDFEAQVDRAIAKGLRVVARPGEAGAFALGVTNAKPLTAEALAELDKRCEADDFEACTDIAVAMRRGEAIDEPARRTALLKKGCAGGDQFGCRQLGTAMVYGYAIARDLDAGIALLDKACTAEDWDACASLGFLYSSTDIVPEADALGVSYYERGCEHGNADACGDLGVMYRDGEGVEQNVAYAASLFKAGCEGGMTNACVNAANLYFNGHGVEEDVEYARELQRYACDLGDRLSCEALKAAEAAKSK